MSFCAFCLASVVGSFLDAFGLLSEWTDNNLVERTDDKLCEIKVLDPGTWCGKRTVDEIDRVMISPLRSGDIAVLGLAVCCLRDITKGCCYVCERPSDVEQLQCTYS